MINKFTAGNPSEATQTTQGDFHGSLRCGTFTEQITVIRDCYADIEHGGTLTAGSPTSPNRIGIGRSLKSGASVTFPTNGLAGLVGINMLTNNGDWENGADVVVGTTTLAKNYPTTFGSIGGGSAGVVAYALHDESCSPPNGSTAISCGPLASALRPAPVVEWRGPASFNFTKARLHQRFVHIGQHLDQQLRIG